MKKITSVINKKKIEYLENYIKKNAPSEDILEIHLYLMQYLTKVEGILTAGGAETDNDKVLALAIDKTIKSKKAILHRIQENGRGKYPLLYVQYNKIQNAEALLNSPLKDTVEALNNRYKDNFLDIQRIDFEYTYDECYFDMGIEERYGNEYTLNFVTLLMKVMAFDLNRIIPSDIIVESVLKVGESYKDDYISQELSTMYLLKHPNAEYIIKTISPSILFRILDIDFKNKNQWPFKDNLIELLRDRLENFNLTYNKLLKMRMLDAKTYQGIDIGSAIHIMIFKEALNSEI